MYERGARKGPDLRPPDPVRREFWEFGMLRCALELVRGAFNSPERGSGGALVCGTDASPGFLNDPVQKDATAV